MANEPPKTPGPAPGQPPKKATPSQAGLQAATQSVKVPVTNEDLKVLEDLVDGSPFSQDAILRVALRIGMMAIQKNPNVILPFLGKKQD